MNPSSSYYYFDGRLFEQHEGAIGVNNRGFRYGDGLFETMRIIDGKAPLLSMHLKRMLTYARVLKIDTSNIPDESEMVSSIQKLLEKNEISGGGKLRMTLFRSAGEGYSPESNLASLLMEASSLPTSQFDYNPKGLVVDLFTEYRKPLNVLSNAKTNNSLIYEMAALHAQEKGLDNVILQNDQFNVAEATNANIFLGVNGVLYTPPVNEGCVDGVMRNLLLQIATRSGIKVYETTIKPNDLLRADELFLTNGLKGIQWVSAYKSKRYFNNTSARLNQLLNQYVKEMEAINPNTP